MNKLLVALIAITFSSCAGSKDNQWALGCVFGIKDAARNFGFGVDEDAVNKYCVHQDQQINRR
jgi:hypothetical protein